MSSVKISELAAITTINANTANTLLMGVDIPTGVTGKFTAHTLAQGLYLNEVLNVGNNSVVFPNTIAQFSGNSVTYLQVNMQNFTSAGSGDFIVTADTGTNANSFVDLGINNSTFSDAAYSSMKPYDGYLYVHGPSDASASGNLIVGTAAANANVSFIIGGTTSDNVVAKLTKTALELQRQITFADGTSQNTSSASAGSYANSAFIKANTPPAIANSAATYANGAFIQANAVFAQSNTVVGVNLTQNTSISSAFIQANAAYTKANSALANTSGTFGGNMFIAGNLSVNGTFLLANSNFTSTESALTISATATTATPSNDGYMIHLSGKDSVPTRLVSDSYGTGAYSLFAGRAARGTVSSPTALQSGDVIARFSGNGYGTTKYQTLGVGRIDFVTAENYTDANTGSQIQFWNCTVGSNTLTNIATFNGDSVTVTGHLEPQRGFVYTPTVYPGVQTAITINMTTNSVVRAQTATGLVVTLSNLLAGKEVVAWITNTAGTNQTFTHGVSALNSSVNATTYSIPGTSTILVRYMSIDGTTQNTFVAITHA
jgi:hypothetical protein